MKRGIIVLLAVIVAATASLAAQETSGSPTTMSKKELRRTMRGYKAFYEAGYDFNNMEQKWTGGNGAKIEAMTIQGFQLNNFFFMGGGIGVNYFTNKSMKSLSVPIFVDARVNLLNRKFSPFFDARAGYALGEENGEYLNLQVGLRYALLKRHAVFIAFEFGWQSHQIYKEKIGTNNSYLCFEENDVMSYLGFKIGYEF